MFGIGFPELILILALALIVVGPDKLPDLARSVAKTIMDLKKTAEGLKDNLNLEDNPLNEIKPELENAAKKFKDTVLDVDKNTWKDDSLPVAQDTNTLDRSTEDTSLTKQSNIYKEKEDLVDQETPEESSPQQTTEDTSQIENTDSKSLK